MTSLERLKISIENKYSVGLAIVGHHDCVSNPALKNDQIVHLQKAIQPIRQQYESIELIGLRVDKNWEVHELMKSDYGGTSIIGQGAFSRMVMPT